MGQRSREERLLEQLLDKTTEVSVDLDASRIQTGGKYVVNHTASRSITTGDTEPIAINDFGETIVSLSAIDNAVLDAMVVDLAAIEVLLTAANVDHAANEVLLTGIAGAIKTEDTAHSTGDKGIMPLAVRNDALATLGGADGDYAPLQVDAFGALYTQNVFGSFGNIFVNDTDAITCGVADRVFVAIYMLTNTVFTLLIAETEQLYLDDTGTSTSVDGDGGTATGSTVFPAGMTLYGRYDGFTLASGSVIAYVG
jgi:hypothetical protein